MNLLKLIVISYATISTLILEGLMIWGYTLNENKAFLVLIILPIFLVTGTVWKWVNSL